MFDSIQDAISVIHQGQLVIVVDDEHRENEGDLVMAAEAAMPENVNFMTKHGRGIICTPLLPDRLDALGIQRISPSESVADSTCAFTVSVDARKGISTGTSAYDRSHTIRLLSNPSATASDFVQPGHVFPIRAQPGGVLQRAGHTEAAVDLATLAGFSPAGVICEIMNDDGSMARLPELEAMAEAHELPVISIADLISYRREREQLVEHIASSRLPTRFGEFAIHAYKSAIDGKEHLALTKGDVAHTDNVLVRVHSECITGDIFGSEKCDCGDQVNKALARIAEEGCGVFVYLRQEGRGIGLGNKIRAYHLQEQGYDTVEANRELGFKEDLREYGIGAQILRDVGVSSMSILTNNPKKIVGLDRFGLEIVEQIPLTIPPTKHNYPYLKAKRDKLGHILDHLDDLPTQPN